MAQGALSRGVERGFLQASRAVRSGRRLRSGSLTTCAPCSRRRGCAKLGGGAIADVVIDRIVHMSDTICVKVGGSMRKRICYKGQ